MINGWRPWRRLEKVLIGLLDLAILAYQKTLSPFFGRKCRYYPSCSTYFRKSLAEYGLLSGISRGIWRIMRCNSLFPGGIDEIVAKKG